MSDRPKSTPSPPEPGETVFRHTFLWRLRRSEDLETLQRLGNLLYTFANEGGLWGGKSDRRPLSHQEVEAAADDLDSLVDYLEEIADSPNRSVLEPEEVSMCGAASGWAGRLARIVVDRKRAVGSLPAAD